MNSATAFATTTATLQPLVQYGGRQDKEATVMKWGVCYGANDNSAWLLAGRVAVDFAKLPLSI
jgi:hypothetical protein